MQRMQTDSAEKVSSASPHSVSASALLYACLVVLLSVLAVGLMFIGTKYAFKNDLHLTPSELSYWNFVIDVPFFISFAFGFLRDRWRPFGIADRPYLLVSPLIIVGCCILAGALPRSLHLLVALLLAINVSAMLGAAAMNGMLAELSKRFGLSGRISAASNVIPRVLGFFLMPLTGKLIESSGFSSVCYVSAGLAFPVVLLAFYRPAALFSAPMGTSPYSQAASLGHESSWRALKRLVCSRSAILAAIIALVWDFTPGWGTPLFYHYTNTLGFSAAQFESISSFGAVANVVSCVIYAFLCFRISTRRRLFLCVAVSLIGCAAYGIVHSFGMALGVSLLVGLTTGIGDAGVSELLYRSSPPKLEAVAVLLGTSGGYLAGDVADIVGSHLYERGGFILALVITLIVTALILPLLYFIPRHVLSSREGEPVPSGE
jgi:hypothetical protein